MAWRKEQEGGGSNGLRPSRDAGGLPGRQSDAEGGNRRRPGAPETPLPNRQAAPEPPPGFLELLDSDPAEAFSRFYAFRWTSLRASPPPFLGRIPRDEREDVISGTISHRKEEGSGSAASCAPAGSRMAGANAIS
jgi:hypothetical protein